MAGNNASFIVYCVFGAVFLVVGLYRLNADPGAAFRHAQRGARWRFGIEGGHPTADFQRRMRNSAITMLVMGVIFLGLAFTQRMPTQSDLLSPTDGVFVTPTPMATASF